MGGTYRFRYGGMSQSGPVYPPVHSQVSGDVQSPRPLQTVGSVAGMPLQRSVSQDCPVYPVSHAQVSCATHSP